MAVKTKSCCFPHAGGDVSRTTSKIRVPKLFSPRRWGCFRNRRLERERLKVFPTQVGMFPSAYSSGRQSISFPHAGGDVSTESSTGEDAWSFPHAGGDVSSSVTPSASTAPVFPTQVGMFLEAFRADTSRICFPHAGGDVSQTNPAFKSKYAFSPRRWGCFRQ